MDLHGRSDAGERAERETAGKVYWSGRKIVHAGRVIAPEGQRMYDARQFEGTPLRLRPKVISLDSVESSAPRSIAATRAVLDPKFLGLPPVRR